MVLELSRARVSEGFIIRMFTDKLCALGYKVYSNIKLDGIEIDILAIEPTIAERPLVHVYEIKTRPKIVLLDQLDKRIPISDYLYVVVPINLYPWIVKKVNKAVGVVVYIGDDFHIIRKAEFIGNGVNVIELIKEREEYRLKCDGSV